jgi:hypothetical protein
VQRRRDLLLQEGAQLQIQRGNRPAKDGGEQDDPYLSRDPLGLMRSGAAGPDGGAALLVACATRSA